MAPEVEIHGAITFDQIGGGQGPASQRAAAVAKLLDALRFLSRPLTPEEEADLLLLKEA